MSLDKISELEEKILFYEAILDNMQNGVMIIDSDGKIIFFSKTYGEFLGINPKEVIGKHCTEVIKSTRMHIVAKTGEPEINLPQEIAGKDMVVQRIPIKINGKLKGVFGQIMFRDVQEVFSLAKKLQILESKVELYEKELVNLRSSKYKFDDIIGVSKEIKEAKNLAMKAAKTNFPVLLLGESGTGKELFAHAIHYASERRLYPFIKINCAAIPKDLLESELFGYEAGAFTGAGTKGKPGKLEMANKGSIFLDEISEMPLEMQPKLLRVLEEKELERLGGTKILKADFRLIVATGENLVKCVESGKFRKDLFYRLNVIPINIPPLRERREDIPLIANYIIKNLNMILGINVKRISDEVMQIFKNYNWPGNVRELQNILERVMSTIDNDVSSIELHHLPYYFRKKTLEVSKVKLSNLKKIKEDVEKEAVINALKITNNNKNMAARLLGIHRTAFYKKIKKYNIFQRVDI